MNKSKLLIALIAGIFFSLPVSAKLYKWVDDKGTTHYGETIPPEYADKDRVELNKAGRVIKTEEVITPERRRAKEQEKARQREQEKTAEEQKRYDKTLISTYSNTEEIDLARKRSLQQIDLRINAINFSVKMAEENLSRLQKESDSYTQQNKKIPSSLTEDLADAKVRLDKLNKDLEKPLAEKAALEARYNADKVRYRELTGKE